MARRGKAATASDCTREKVREGEKKGWRWTSPRRGALAALGWRRGAAKWRIHGGGELGLGFVGAKGGCDSMGGRGARGVAYKGAAEGLGVRGRWRGEACAGRTRARV
jgi:hypothetical protein